MYVLGHDGRLRLVHDSQNLFHGPQERLGDQGRTSPGPPL